MATAPVKAPSPSSTNKILMLSQFNTQILDLEQRYGVQLSFEIKRNVPTANGDLNQWLGRVWYKDGVTDIGTTAIGATFDTMINSLVTHLTQQTLKDHAQVVSARRTA
jgi:hypothetical protein